ncbi:long-chain fatty acid--CoA ligase [Croceicoccus ponticola]|uniref:Long-chain fatty acid--CoA ligase n=1 Tax=Croceicoccus ponticola TaxID=2217664 RepID=A0A437GZA1_9SPHN|nr:AMP-binding protein [Croceicoccus ponticola]RVQ68678.1 long-chain fatty acid--CoA ligase [Croceicoccus ponticola]
MIDQAKAISDQPFPLPDPLTVGGALFAISNRFGDLPALVYGQHRASWRELSELSIAMARRLVGLGVQPGEHVGVLMPNCFEYIVLYLATQLAGANAVLLNARYRPDDLAYVVPKADVDYLFVGGHAARHCDYRPMLEEAFPGIGGEFVSAGGHIMHPALPRLKRIVELGEDRPGAWMSPHAFAALDGDASRDEVIARTLAVLPDDIGLMIFSSGTTNRPKACMIAHRSLCITAKGMAGRFRLTEQDVVWDPLPLFHMSTILPLAGCRETGACFMGMDHFDADVAMKLLIAERPTVQYAGFPTIIGALVAHPDFAKYDQSRLRINHVVGPPDLLRRYADDFPGAVPVNSYGLTEATGVPCYSDLDDPRDLLFTTSGKVYDGVEAQIVGPDGAERPDGDPGEICLRGNVIFAGYYQDPDATKEAIDADGWLHTGDLGRIGPGGRLVYEGRLKDMLKIGGENVAAVELESFLMTHPAVRMAQVIGVPDDRLMEVAAAFIEVQPGKSIAPEDIISHCEGRIASYKIPRYIRFVEDWPMSATKVQKFELAKGFEPHSKFEPHRKGHA